MSRQKLMLFALMICAFAFGSPLATSAEPKPVETPNVLLIFVDNLGYGDLGCYGNPDIKTPHIDKLAAEGVRCTDFYTASPTCTVSRASLLTGRYPQRHGLNIQLPGLEGNYGVGLRHSEMLLSEPLLAKGYRTACFGKWNIGFAPGSRPTDRGFEEFFGHASGNIHYYTHIYNGRLDMHEGTEPVQVEGYSTDLFADAAIDFIDRNAEQPFFVYLPFNAVHFIGRQNVEEGEELTWQVPTKYLEEYGWPVDESDEKRRYFAVVTALDDAIGRVLGKLDETGLADKTIVIFLSDNGAFMLEGRGLEVASNAPLRDGGVTLWEGGIRVPCVVRWPGRLPAGTDCREPLLSCDFFPMIVNATGAKLPEDRQIDGRDPTKTLAGEATSPHEILFFQFRGYSALLRGNQKLLRERPDAPWMLFDLLEDLGETNDLAQDRPEVVAELEGLFEDWLKSTTEEEREQEERE